MSETPIEWAPCPGCGAPNDDYTIVGDAADLPIAGALAACWFCGTITILALSDDVLRWVLPPVGETEAIMAARPELRTLVQEIRGRDQGAALWPPS